MTHCTGSLTLRASILLALVCALSVAPGCSDHDKRRGRAGDAGGDAEVEADADRQPDGSVPDAERPAHVPPGCGEPLEQSAATRFYDAARCIFEGDQAVQYGVEPETISVERVAIVRGRVLDSDGQPLEGVRVSVLRGDEYGYTETREGGFYDLALNGGALVTLRFQRAGLLPVQRHQRTSWRRFSVFPDVVMLAPAAPAPTVELGALEAPRWVEGPLSHDDSGERRHALLLRPGTRATMRFSDGNEEEIDALDFRITEYTVGSSGPAAMPGDLPATSAYTYALDLTVMQAEEAGAERVVFDPPLVTYVENFLDFPAGTSVPLGAYESQRDEWQASESGVVLSIVAIEDGLAQLDVSGDGEADDEEALAAHGIDREEQAALAERYALGQSLWRAVLPHFSPWDCNWAFGPPEDAEEPPEEEEEYESDGCGPTRSGSIVGCEAQTLGERFALVGTPYALSYQSERMPGRRDANELEIGLSGPTVPFSLKRIELEVEILGQLIKRTFAPEPNQRTHITWDGLDAYGRAFQGRQEASVRVGFVYDGVYQRTTRFARPGDGVAITGDPSRGEITFWSSWKGWLGKLDQTGLGLGGLSLSVHHVYDPSGRVLYQGDGVTRTVESLGATIDTVAGTGTSGFSGDGAAARSGQLDGPHAVVVAPDGTVYISDELNNRVRRISPSGIIDTYAGNGENEPLGEGGPATQAGIPDPLGLALAPDGTLFIAARDGLVRAVSPQGVLRVVAGGGPRASGSGDGGPASAARFGEPHALALGEDGTLFVADAEEHCIRRIGTDGLISTVAGGGTPAEGDGDGDLATRARLRNPLGLSVGPDGSVYVAEFDGHRIRRIDPRGVISTVAGTGSSGFAGDGGPAQGALLNSPHTVDVGRDGAIYISDEGNRRVRRVRPDGIIETLAGSGRLHSDGASEVGDLGAASASTFARPRVVYLHQDGTLWVADYDDGRVRRVRPALPGFSLGEVLIASASASELHRFDSHGRHRETIASLTNALVRSFEYDAAGRLIEVKEAGGQRTRIERDADGNPTEIVGPYGHVTKLVVNDQGWVTALERPLGDVIRLSYADGGLLASLDVPGSRGREVTSFDYDERGRLVSDDHPTGLAQTLAREPLAAGVRVVRTLGAERSESFEVTRRGDGSLLRTHTDMAGLVTTTESSSERFQQQSPLERLSSVRAGDPRFGLLSPLSASSELQSGSVRANTGHTRSVQLADPGNPLSLVTLDDVVTINDHSFRSHWDASTRTLTSTSPMGRVATITFDARGRIVREQFGGLAPWLHTYDAQDRLIESSQGDDRAAFEYAPSGEVASVSNALGEVTQLAHDAESRLVGVTYPDGSELRLAYHPGGALAAVTPPERTPHRFEVGVDGLLESYVPPESADTSDTPLSYSYDLYQAPSVLEDAQGARLALGYEATTGRLASASHPHGQLAFSYAPTTGLLSSIESGETTLTYGYNGSLPTRREWQGAVRSTVVRAYNRDFSVTSETAGGQRLEYTRDADGLVVGLGNLVVERSPATGAVTGSSLGGVRDSWSYDERGFVTAYSASVSAALYTRSEQRDALGRVIERTESVLGEQHVLRYDYDARGRLVEVHRDGARVEAYAYDANHNRLHAARDDQELEARYGARDELLALGEVSYAYDARGNVSERVEGGARTQLSYDMLGALRSVTLPDGRQIEYLIDGENRRVGRRVDGALTHGYLYSASGRLVAQLGPNGTSVTGRFGYVTRDHVPDFMVRGGQTYRLITDALGSVRLVVNSADGSVAQRLDYDAFGRVLADSSPGFQPFGFAGGLYDHETGLVRFGARDYDAQAGRWTARDPILFEGGQDNLYAYVGNDPVNFIDPSGEFANLVVGCLGGAAIGYGVSALTGDCYGAGDAARDCVLGALGAGVFDELFKLGRAARAAGGGAERLVIGRGADLSRPGALNPGEFKFQWPSKLPNYKAEWKVNEGLLRQEMRNMRPVRDASPGDTGGIFLNAERNLLRDRGWTFNAETNLWTPPGGG